MDKLEVKVKGMQEESGGSRIKHQGGWRTGGYGKQVGVMLSRCQLRHWHSVWPHLKRSDKGGCSWESQLGGSQSNDSREFPGLLFDANHDPDKAPDSAIFASYTPLVFLFPLVAEPVTQVSEARPHRRGSPSGVWPVVRLSSGMVVVFPDLRLGCNVANRYR